MTLRPIPVVFLFALALGLAACASPKTLTGGEKDTTPPAVVEEGSTPNKQINFQDKKITLLFDEWVTLKDARTQLVVSPVMPHDPEIKQKGKAVIIELPDSLSENTTYTLNFGNAITDLNEGNILENYTFVFSTGDFLDSIQLNGKVMDAVTLQPSEGVWVMLHPAGIDSAIYKNKPAYVAKTNKEGKWSLSNIRVDSFRLFALKDDNVNFLYDQESEMLGWRDSVIFTDESVFIPPVSLFAKEPRMIVQETKQLYPGYMKLIIPGPNPKPVPEFVPALREPAYLWDRDTLHVFYPPDHFFSGNIILGNDTTKVREPSGKPPVTPPLKLLPASTRIHPLDELVLKSDVPLAAFVSDDFHITNDSVGTITARIRLDSLNPRQIHLKSAWQPTFKYDLLIDPGAITDYWGRTNDTLRYTFATMAPDQYGQYKIHVIGLDSTRQYIVQLVAGKNIAATFIATDQPEATWTTAPLLPAKYGMEIIEDLNRNGTWDTGNYEKRRQPEQRKTYTPDALRAGWDVEVSVSWK